MDKETKKCISIAGRPSAFGVEFHNRGYEMFGLNFVYVPLKVKPGELEAVIQVVRDNCRGCSVSMPHKTSVMGFLDELGSSAEKVGAVNTIVNNDGKLKGYNTDYHGAKRALEKYGLRDKEVVMVGAGGFARAVGHAVSELGANLSVVNRAEDRGRKLAGELGASFVPWDDRNKTSGYLFVNATSVGMENPEDSVIDLGTVENFDVVMDAVVIHETSLQRGTRDAGKVLVSGSERTVYQAAEQFKLYTGTELPRAFIESFLKS